MRLSALTLQKHVRGWLTRRRYLIIKEKQRREQIALEQELEKERQNAKNKQIFGRAALLQRLASKEHGGGNEKETRAAVVIQSCKFRYFYKRNKNSFEIFLDFRGYTIRKNKYGPEKEAKVKLILNTAKNRTDAQKMLSKEGFKSDDIVRLIQKYFR